jgi:hypothetical protein
MIQMTFFEVYNWEDQSMEELTRESVRKLLQTDKRYRVSENVYPANATFSQISRKGWCYIKSGIVEIHSNDNDKTIRLVSNNFVLLPDGEFIVRICGDTDAIIINVWELPF